MAAVLVAATGFHQSSPVGDMVDLYGTELFDGLTTELSDRAVVKHPCRGGPRVKSLDALS